MGPITLFDKSFLQSLSIDESMWFDHHFLTNICPMFYVETLGDLDKSVREGRTPEQEVGIIASKFPEMHGSPNAHHSTLSLANLMGYPVPMDGRVPLAGGRPVKTHDRTGVVFDRSPEAEAFARWQQSKFREVEKLFSREWRESLKSLDLNQIADGFRAIGIDGRKCKKLEDAKAIAIAVAAGRDKPFDRMKLAIVFLGIPSAQHGAILERWSIAGYPALVDYAPYTAYVLTVEVFFQLALAAHLISTERASNRLDIAYLYYLPFCMLFVSCDRLHQRCAPLFLRKDQEFVWGGDLKADLQRLNGHYAVLPEATKEQGVMKFASGPPNEGDFLVTKIWDRHLPRWRIIRGEPKPDHDPEKEAELVKKLNEVTKAPVLQPDEVDFDLHDPDTLSIERYVAKRKGSWWQLPKDLEVSEEDE